MSLAIKQARFASQGGRSGNVQAGGIFGSIFGGIKKGISAALGTVPVIGPAIAIGTTIAKRRGGAGAPAPPRPPPLTFGGPGPIAPSAAAVGVVGTTIACPSGFHANKSSYFTLAGHVPKGSRCVRNRRRNPMNPRALDRAISRVDSGKRLQSKLASITTAKYTAAGARKPHTHE